MKISLDQGISGSVNALKEACATSDIIIIAANRATGEFKIGAYPPEPSRMIEMMEKALARLKQQAQNSKKSVIIQ